MSVGIAGSIGNPTTKVTEVIATAEDAMKTKLGRLIFVGAQSFGTLRVSRFRAAQHAAAPGGRRAVGKRPQASADRYLAENTAMLGA